MSNPRFLPRPEGNTIEGDIVISSIEGFDGSCHSVWASLVENYSKRLLTQQTDRLVAILGMTKTFHSLLSIRFPGNTSSSSPKDKYLAGLWSDGFSAQLLWRVVKSRQSSGFSSNKSMPYVAPSWSWASVDAEVSDAYSYLSPTSETWSGTDLIHITSASTELLQPNEPFGQVFSGCLVIKGKLASCYTGADSPRLLFIRTRSGIEKLNATDKNTRQSSPPFELHWDTPPLSNTVNKEASSVEIEERVQTYLLIFRTSSTRTLANVAKEYITSKSGETERPDPDWREAGKGDQFKI